MQYDSEKAFMIYQSLVEEQLIDNIKETLEGLDQLAFDIFQKYIEANPQAKDKDTNKMFSASKLGFTEAFVATIMFTVISSSIPANLPKKDLEKIFKHRYETFILNVLEKKQYYFEAYLEALPQLIEHQNKSNGMKDFIPKNKLN